MHSNPIKYKNLPFCINRSMESDLEREIYERRIPTHKHLILPSYKICQPYISCGRNFPFNPRLHLTLWRESSFTAGTPHNLRTLNLHNLCNASTKNSLSFIIMPHKDKSWSVSGIWVKHLDSGGFSIPVQNASSRCDNVGHFCINWKQIICKQWYSENVNRWGEESPEEVQSIKDQYNPKLLKRKWKEKKLKLFLPAFYASKFSIKVYCILLFLWAEKKY